MSTLNTFQLNRQHKTNLTNTTYSEHRGIQEHMIILSVDELFAHHDYLIDLSDAKKQNRTWSPIDFFGSPVDSSVCAINQIMFAFNRNNMFVTESKGGEVWYWN